MSAETSKAGLTIDVWADVICPWCYIGEERLSRAIARSASAQDIELRLHTYQLDPNASREAISTFDYLTKKYGASPAQARTMEEGMALRANELGLEYRVERRISNTFDMLRLVHLGAEHDVAWDYMRAMQVEVFGGNEDAFAQETLVRLGVALGIPESEIRDVLSSERYADSVREDHTAALQLGAEGVPFTVLDRRFAVRGAVSIEDYAAAIEQASRNDNG